MNQSYGKVWLVEDNNIIIEKEATPYPVVNVVNLRPLALAWENESGFGWNLAM